MGDPLNLGVKACVSSNFHMNSWSVGNKGRLSRRMNSSSLGVENGCRW